MFIKTINKKIDALYLFSATTIHNMNFICFKIQSFVLFFYNLEEFQSLSKMLSDFSYNFQKKK